MLILDGRNDQERFKIVQDKINDMTEISGDIDSKNESRHYNQLLKNIIRNNVRLN